MRIVSVGDIAERIDYGITASAMADPVGPKMLRITDIQDGAVNWSSVPYCSRTTKGVETRQLAAGDIVFARTGTVGKSFLIRERPEGAVFASYLIRLRLCHEVADSRYVSHFFRSPGYWQQIASASDGGVQKGVNATKLRNLLVPLPPIEDQRRIAAVLDAADALRAKRRQAIAKLDSLTQAIFVDMFGDPVSNPRGWPADALTKLGDLDRGVSKHRPRNDPVLLGGDWPLIQTGDVAASGGYIMEFTATYSDVGLAQSKIWPVGTLCITIAANIAKTGILTFEACFPDSVVGFTAGTKGASEYVRCFLNSLQPVLEKQAPESAQKNINLKILRELQVPIPPEELMVRFTERASEVNALGLRGFQQQMGLDALFASLQQRAFRGEL